jgi:O-antigen/teichoic acid export membrane protein
MKIDNISIKGSLSNRLLKGGKWAATGKLLRSFSGLAVNALLARLLAPDSLGIYFLLLSVSTLLSIVARAGMDIVIVRFSSEYLTSNQPERVGSLLIRAYTLVSVGILIVAVAYWSLGGRLAAGWFGAPDFDSFNMLCIFWLTALSCQFILDETFRGIHQTPIAVLLDGVISTTVNCVLFSAVWLVYGELSIVSAIQITLSSLVVAVLIGIYLIVPVLRQKPDAMPRSYPELWSVGWPQIISTIALFNLSQAAVLLLGVFQAPAAVAIYVTALKLMIVIRLPQFVVNAVIPPIIVELNTLGNKDKLERLLRGVTSLAFFASASVCVIYLIFGEEILALVYGETYREGYWILVVLSIGQAINVGVGSCGKVLALTGNQQVLMVIAVMTLIVSIATGVGLVGRYGGEGVAMAFSVGVIFQSGTALIMARRRSGIWTHIILVPSELMAAISFMKKKLVKNS